MSIVESNKDRVIRNLDYRNNDYMGSAISNRYLDNKKQSDVKITETESSFHYELKIPGYIKEDFNFYINNKDLVVTTEKKEIKKAYSEGKKECHSYCYPSALFKRKIELPKKIVKDRIFVDYKDEVLSFDLLKKNV